VYTTQPNKEQEMSLSALKLTAAKKPTNQTAEQHRRSKMIKRIDEQIKLATAQQRGDTYTASKTKHVVNAATGERELVSVSKRVKSWWFPVPDGRIALTVRYGSQVLELAKGKFSIDVVDFDHLPATLQVVRDAVAKGELDAQIAQASTSLRKGFGK
jgi:TRAP-type mannitol/chloroaromatic compound transport system substrate-binding protein